MMDHTSVAGRCDAVVVGYGSPLRSDDAVGLRVAEVVESWGLPGVNSIATHGLTPDIAATLADAQLAIFIDARIDALDQGVLIQPIAPLDSIDRVGHTSDPRQLLALARIVFGQAPEALLVTIPAFETQIGEEFSERTSAFLAEALERIAGLLHGRK